MPVTILIPGALRGFSGGRARVELPGRPASVGEALAVLAREHPGVVDRTLDEQGEVRPHVNLFVGAESIRYSGGLQTPLGGDAEMSIIPAVSGGCTRVLD